jgi:hypothetical protein
LAEHGTIVAIFIGTAVMIETTYEYDIIVIGAGHAGTEAAAAAARMGARTVLLTTNLDTVGQMSCNPAIGGVAKGQIVREIDALGGLMGQAIDATGIQFRMLNCRKGPAMHSPRAQADKRGYQTFIKHRIEQQPGLDLRQETVEDLLTETAQGQTRVGGVRVRGDAVYRAGAVTPRPPAAEPVKGRRPGSAARWRDSGSRSIASRPARPPACPPAGSTSWRSNANRATRSPSRSRS